MKRMTGMFSVAATVALIGGTLLAASPANASDGWLGSRNCPPSDNCRSSSTTHGVAGSYPYHYVMHKHNSVQSTNWPMTATSTVRTFTSQIGSVDVFIYTTDFLTAQSATCICVRTPCMN